MPIYEFRFSAELPEGYDPAGLELLMRQGIIAMVPQVGGQIVDDVSATEIKPPKKT